LIFNLFFDICRKLATIVISLVTVGYFHLSSSNFVKIFALVLLLVTGACESSTGEAGPTATARPQAEIVAESKSSVVRVETTTNSGDFTGSGFVLAGSSNVVATAYHVVEDANAIWIRREDESDSTKIAAELIAFDEVTDLALLRVTDLGGGIELSDSSLDAGKSVLALGFPLGLLGSVSVSQGIISRRVEFEGDFFVQHDAEILQGNSGGPLLDDSGRVIGINILVVPDGVITSAGLNFAVHVGELIQLMQSVGIESSIVAAIPTSTPVPTPTFTPVQVDAAATAVLRLREIDTISATSTVLARALGATIEAEGTVAAKAVATRQAQATAAVKSESTVVAKAVATEQAEEAAIAREIALSSIATIEAVVQICDGKSGESLIAPFSGSIENTSAVGVGHSGHPFSVGAADFQVSVTLINPSDGEWDHGLLFHDNGTYGDALIFRAYRGTSWRNYEEGERPGAKWEHYFRVKGVWTLADSGNLLDPAGGYFEWDVRDKTGNFLSSVREPNKIKVDIEGNHADVFTNGEKAFSLNLGVPAPDQTRITPIVGLFEDSPDKHLDFVNFSVTCP